MSLDEYWDLVWLGPTEAEVNKACGKVTPLDIARVRAEHPQWSEASDVAVRALLVIESVGKKR